MTASRPLPSVDVLNNIFRYDAEVGELRWRLSGRNRVAGAVAGTVNAGGYRQIQIVVDGSPRIVLAHRVIFKLFTGLEPDVIDHRRGVEAGNFFENLRAANRKLNRWNSRKRGNRELPKHVQRARSKFAVSIHHEGKRYVKSGFLTPEAAEAYALDLTRGFHREFAASEGVAVVSARDVR